MISQEINLTAMAEAATQVLWDLGEKDIQALAERQEKVIGRAPE